jgi:hypothetical protein
VDGQEVSGVGRDGGFELLPGCRVVEITRRDILVGRLLIWGGDLGPNTFVFDMKPGYEYSIVADNGSSMTIPVHAIEHGPSGARTRTIDPVDPASAPKACKVLGT